MNYYNEWDLNNANWLRALIEAGEIPNGEIDARSITEISANEIRGYDQYHFFAGIGGWSRALKIAGWPDREPVCTGSCPCQPFGTSGQKNMQSDERHLWPSFAGLIKELKFPIIFGEQVDEAISAGWLDDAFYDLEKEDYACAAAVLSANASGASFKGSRLYFCAKAASERLPGSRKHIKPINQAEDCFREADSFINVFQKNAMPYVCTRHDGVSTKLAKIALHGAGNAIVPEQAARFIAACIED